MKAETHCVLNLTAGVVRVSKVTASDVSNMTDYQGDAQAHWTIKRRSQVSLLAITLQ